MAKLPPKPMNVVHEYFPVGTDGQSPFNRVETVAYNKTGLVPEKRTVTDANRHLFEQGQPDKGHSEGPKGMVKDKKMPLPEQKGKQEMSA